MAQARRHWRAGTDAGGRPISEGGTLVQTVLPAPQSGSTCNIGNQLTSFGSKTYSYDADSNPTGDGASAYTWNHRGQLASVTTGSATAKTGYVTACETTAAPDPPYLYRPTAQVVRLRLSPFQEHDLVVELQGGPVLAVTFPPARPAPPGANTAAAPGVGSGQAASPGAELDTAKRVRP